MFSGLGFSSAGRLSAGARIVLTSDGVVHHCPQAGVGPFWTPMRPVRIVYPANARYGRCPAGDVPGDPAWDHSRGAPVGDAGVFRPVIRAMGDQWLTYSAAAKMLGMTPESVRQRTRREGWRRQLGNDGRALILVPADTARNTAGDTGDDTPGDPPASRPVIRPKRDTAALQARLQEIEGRAAELRAELEREQAERHQERDRADRLAGEVADLARQIAKLADEAASRERDLRDQLTAERTEHTAELMTVREQLAVAVNDRDRLTAALRAHLTPWWKKLIG